MEFSLCFIRVTMIIVPWLLTSQSKTYKRIYLNDRKTKNTKVEIVKNDVKIKIVVK
jgi:hypothetical protein